LYFSFLFGHFFCFSFFFGPGIGLLSGTGCTFVGLRLIWDCHKMESERSDAMGRGERLQDPSKAHRLVPRTGEA